MKLLDLTLPTAEENIALDEALLDAAESSGKPAEILRLWEAPSPLVVVGRSSRVAEEVNLTRCEEQNIPVLRRASGGAAIVAGPGCLMYTVILSYETHPALRLLDQAHRFVLGGLMNSLASLLPGVHHLGISDLALEGRKFSGNALRCKQQHLLYHGTLLYDFDLPLIGDLLATAPRQPEYRAGRDHREFVTNLPISGARLREKVAAAFSANEPETCWPQVITSELVARRYSRREWNHER